MTKIIYHEWTYLKENFLGQREIKPIENLEFKMKNNENGKYVNVLINQQLANFFCKRLARQYTFSSFAGQTVPAVTN